MRDSPGSRPASYPQWGSIFRILEGFGAGLRRAEDLTARARTVEASDILHELRDDLLHVGVRLSAAEQGPEAWRTLERLALDLPRQWASGSFAQRA